MRLLMRSASRGRKGAASIEITIAAIAICAARPSSAPVVMPSVRITKPNSPAGARSDATILASAVFMPNRCAKGCKISALPTSRPTSVSSTQPSCEATNGPSSCIPTEMKNMPSSTSRKGRISSST